MFVSMIRRMFGWWHVATIGTVIHTFFKGVKIGQDALGNEYYISKKGDKRWVIYNGEIEATNIQPEWHAWLHKIIDETPLEKPRTIKSWEKDHLPNQTGTINAYSPKGALSQGGKRQKTTGDYEAWTPNS